MAKDMVIPPEPDDVLLKEAVVLLRNLMPFIGLAHCSGYKCRLPHCECCEGEECADRADKDRIKYLDRAYVFLNSLPKRDWNDDK